MWQLAHDVTLAVYRATRGFPTDERFGLTAQLRRASSSIASNIAEGCARPQGADFARFLDIASGSANEVLYQVRLATDLGYMRPSAAEGIRRDLLEINNMLGGLRRHIRRG